MKKEIVLPETIKECHELIIDLTRQIEQLQRRAFGSLKDRACKYEGPSLFDELEEEEHLAATAKLDNAIKEVETDAKRRREEAKEAKRNARPEKYNTYGLPEEHRTEIPEGINVEDYDIIGYDTNRILHLVPQKLWVEVIKRPVLRAKKDKNAPSPQIIQAPAPYNILGGGHVAADLLSTLIVNKFCHHLPEYRQVKMFSDLGLKLPTSTVNNWIHAAAQVLYPLYESQREAIIKGGYLQVDEVPWRIADRQGQACRKGYAWQFRDVSPENRGTFFYYYKGSRGAETPRAQLKDFKGAIQTDGYKVYDYFENVSDVVNLACMAHVRRKFIDAQSSNPLASEFVKYIAALYTLEENLKTVNADFEEIQQERQRLAVPILDGMHTWMLVAIKNCTPSEPLAKAIKYTIGLWPRIKRYTENGMYQIDSNPVEQGQRPSVLGRKNYLFSQNNRGAEDNAIFYTFVVSCEILGVSPTKWFNNALNKIRPNMDEEELINLLPYKFKADL